jgi:hypothetical protein
MAALGRAAKEVSVRQGASEGRHNSHGEAQAQGLQGHHCVRATVPWSRRITNLPAPVLTKIAFWLLSTRFWKVSYVIHLFMNSSWIF